MILVRNIRMELNDPPERLAQKAARRLGIREGEILSAELIRRSLDARRKISGRPAKERYSLYLFCGPVSAPGRRRPGTEEQSAGLRKKGIPDSRGIQ